MIFYFLILNIFFNIFSYLFHALMKISLPMFSTCSSTISCYSPFFCSSSDSDSKKNKKDRDKFIISFNVQYFISFSQQNIFCYIKHLFRQLLAKYIYVQIYGHPIIQKFIWHRFILNLINLFNVNKEQIYFTRCILKTQNQRNKFQILRF